MYKPRHTFVGKLIEGIGNPQAGACHSSIEKDVNLGY